ncbi:Putative acyltransferase plsB1 [Paraconexibacter sp. AEG42_29]|uniref:Acyltransferase plsB1 n=1 Tax=Paraconexibacter sp. AEG42_29 TaxID=2997339 RepID=A0AAU7AQW0_9ACTN
MSSPLVSDPRFVEAVDSLADRLGEDRAAVMVDAEGCLEEMRTRQQRVARAIWARWAKYLYSRAYTLTYDAAALQRIRELGRDHPLVFLPSHRSNLDGYVMASLLYQQGFAANHTLGGINMAFWPIGALGRRTGVIWIRRSFRDDEVYKLALQHYLGHVVRQGNNLEWYIEGGRTRTGKLLPPKLGLFNYLADAVEDLDVEGVQVIPTSIVYDELPEAKEVTSESHGAVKPPEGLGWLLHFARQQRGDYGGVQVNFGDPIDLSDALKAAGSDPADRSARRLARHKVAIEVCARINRATPATAQSLLTLALLGVEDRALTFKQVQDVLAPVLRYVIARGLPADEAARRLTTQDGVSETLATLVAHGVVDRFDGGTEAVFGIGSEQALVAGFYRNISIHWFVDRAITELALLRAAEDPGEDVVQAAWDEAFRLRDLLKFDFFFGDREQSRRDLTAEIELIEPDWREQGREYLGEIGPAMLRSGALMAPRILRSFVESHLIVADRLQALGEWPADPALIAQDCLGLGRQYLKQRRITNRDAVSLHLFSPAVKLCGNYGLLEGPDVLRRRADHAAYLHAVQRRLAAAVDLDHASLADALVTS